MTDWIPATRETAGYYADDPPQPYPPTCRERQDAAINDLLVLAGYAQAATERLTRELAALQKRIAALESQHATFIDALEADAQADVSFILLEPVRDDGAEDVEPFAEDVYFTPPLRGTEEATP